MFTGKQIRNSELNSTLEEELKSYLPGEELQYILSKKNKATQLTALQSEELIRLKTGEINDFEWTLLQQSIIKFTDDQEKRSV